MGKINFKNITSFLAIFALLNSINISNAKARGMDGNAYRVCDSYTSISKYNKCTRIIRGYRFNKGALSICDTYTSATLTNKCLRIIRGHHFNKRSLAECDSYAESKATNKCLQRHKGPGQPPIFRKRLVIKISY